MIITFGKYAGEDLEDIPSEYLQWLIGNYNPAPVGNPKRQADLDLISECEAELASRKKFGAR